MSNRKGFCVSPFRYAEFTENGDVWQCCTNWIPNPMGNILKENWNSVWNSDDAKKLRQTMHDGTLSMCDETQCPYLQIWNKGEEDYSGYFPIYNENSFDKLWNAKEINPNGKEKYQRIIKEKLVHLPWGPESVAFSHDRSCNLSCPSCRLELFNSKGKDREKSYKIQNIILGEPLCDSHELYITSSGDPFGSDIFRDILKSINLIKFPNIKNIHLHTNGIGWTEKQWKIFSNLHTIPRITADISIDAARKETYEIIRRGGKWELLNDNLKFIFSGIPNLSFVRLTFVVQDLNYMEMNEFVDLAEKLESINNINTEINFTQVNNWGTWSDGEFNQRKVMRENHILYDKFIIEYKKILERKKNTKVKIILNF